ncbi:contractile injection system tape measure protein [Danxiaibacter flavus]|uniref:Contractile injection system tape measure protein n=1 Tax=Danxiaibacter flavus TaxID=3049108 RepID=A0ABV3ZCA5_9BACT|nr:contractile injection system tape measure protein [Chitinophagaceae bacterium DXS]
MKNDFVIQEVMFDVDFSSRSKAHNLQNALSKLYNERWHYVMQDFFEEHISPHTRLHIDSIVLDLGTVPYDNLEDAITKSLMDALAAMFIKRPGYDNTFAGNGSETELFTGKLDVLSYFFTTGLLPWWTSIDLLRDINKLVDDLLKGQADMLVQMIRKAGKVKAARQRLIGHVQDPTLKSLVAKMLPGEADFISEYHDNVVSLNEKDQVIKSESKVVSKALWEIILAFLIEEYGSHFNRKEFTKSTLRSMAAHFGVHYEDLLLLLINHTSSSRAKEQLPLLQVLHEIADELVETQNLADKQEVSTQWKYALFEKNKLMQDTHALLYFLMNGSLPAEVGSFTKSRLFGIFRTFLNNYPVTLQAMIRGLFRNEQLFENVFLLAEEKTVGMLLRLFQPVRAIALRDMLIGKENQFEKTGSSLVRLLLHKETLEYLLRNPFVETHALDQYLQQKLDAVIPLKNNIPATSEIAEVLERSTISAYDLIVFFLRNGVLPWWAADKNPIEALNTLIAGNKMQARAVLVFAGTSKTMRERLLLQFPLATIAELFKLLPSSTKTLDAIDSVVQLGNVLNVRSSQTGLPLLYEILWLNYIDFRYESWSPRLFLLQSVTWIVSKDVGKPYVQMLYILTDIINSADNDVLSIFKAAIRQITYSGFARYSIKDFSSAKHLINNIQYAFALEPAFYKLETAGLVEMFFPAVTKQQLDAILNAGMNSVVLIHLLDIVNAGYSDVFDEFKTAMSSYPVLMNKLKMVLWLHNQQHLLTGLEVQHKNVHDIVLLDMFNKSDKADRWSTEKWQTHLEAPDTDMSSIKNKIGDVVEYILTWGSLPPSITGVQYHQVVLQAVIFLYVNDKMRLQQLLTSSKTLPSVRLQLYHLFKDAEPARGRDIAAFIEQYAAYDKWKYARSLTIDKSLNANQKKTSFEKTGESVTNKDDSATLLSLFLSNRDQSSLSVPDNAEAGKLLNATDVLFRQDKHLLEDLLASSSVDPVAKMRLHLLFEKFRHSHNELFTFLNRDYEKDLLLWGRQIFGFDSQRTETAQEMFAELLNHGGVDQVRKFLQVAAGSDKILDLISVKVSLNKLEDIVISVSQKWGEEAVNAIKAMNTMLLALSAEVHAENRMQILLNKFYLEWLSGNRNIYDIKSFMRSILDEAGIREILRRLDKNALAVNIDHQFKGEHIRQIIRSQIGFLSVKSSPELSNSTDASRSLLKQHEHSMQLYELVSQQLNAEQKAIDEKNKALLPQGDVSKIYINNAGLVLLQPFIPFYFQLLGLTENNIFVDDASRHRAALLTQYLVNGQTEMAEFDLPLNKILCAINFEEVVPSVLELSEQEVRISEELFKTLFQRWDKMKNSSIENFRNAFMQRQGSLVKMQDGWTLKVEQRGYDILLETLPWSYRMIKFKWMDKPLYVEWI